MPRSRSSSNRSRRRPSRRTPKPSVWKAICGANERAHQRVNKRAMRRDGKRSLRAAIAESQDDILHLPPLRRFIHWMLGLALLPLCVISTMALLTIGDGVSVGERGFWTELLLKKEFIWFAVGMVLMLTWFFSKLLDDLFLYFYVLGHEVTHAIFVIGCFGRVSGIRVNVDGGYIVTNKTNVLIALSPYFVPFWSVMFLFWSWMLSLVIDIPHRDEILYFLLGASWCFHMFWTLWMIPRDQPDLQENGTFFSLVFIYLANVLVLSLLLCLAMGNGALQGFAEHWWNLFEGFLRKMYHAI